MRRPALFALVGSGVAAALLFIAEPARAFERQWHLGAGLGAGGPTGDYTVGPVLGLHAAYGISDVFDARLELQGSAHSLGDNPLSLYGARLGLAYKLDVIQWIPYVGISGGGFVLAGATWIALRPSAGAFAGLDYAVSRHFGVGGIGLGDYVFTAYGKTVVSFLFRAEYRFGW